MTLRVTSGPSAPRGTSGTSGASGNTPAKQQPATPTVHEETIATTRNHPWLTADAGWVWAGWLRVGEPVRLVDGRTAEVVALREVPGAAEMWDLTVSQVHTFAVGDGAFVVHNTECWKLPRYEGKKSEYRIDPEHDSRCGGYMR